MDESIEIRNICDWVRFQDRRDGGGTPVNLIPGNDNAARIYMLCRNQTVNIFNGEQDVIVDINHLAVWAAIDHDCGDQTFSDGRRPYRITNPYDCFTKVINVFHTLLKERKAEDE